MNTSLSNIKAVAKRELIGYFSSPVAYVFLVIFVLTLIMGLMRRGGSGV